MYLHTILQRKPSEMIRKIYEAQKTDPSPGDFCLFVQDDLAEVGLDITEREIAIMSKERFHTIIKTKVRSAALEYLKKLQKKHSKMET